MTQTFGNPIKIWSPMFPHSRSSVQIGVALSLFVPQLIPGLHDTAYLIPCWLGVGHGGLESKMETRHCGDSMGRGLATRIHSSSLREFFINCRSLLGWLRILAQARRRSDARTCCEPLVQGLKARGAQIPPPNKAPHPLVRIIAPI